MTELTDPPERHSTQTNSTTDNKDTSRPKAQRDRQYRPVRDPLSTPLMASIMYSLSQRAANTSSSDGGVGALRGSMSGSSRALLRPPISAGACIEAYIEAFSSPTGYRQASYEQAGYCVGLQSDIRDLSVTHGTSADAFMRFARGHSPSQWGVADRNPESQRAKCRSPPYSPSDQNMKSGGGSGVEFAEGSATYLSDDLIWTSLVPPEPSATATASCGDQRSRSHMTDPGVQGVIADGV